MKKLVVGVAVIAAMLCTCAVWAQGTGGGGAAGGGRAGGMGGFRNTSRAMAVMVPRSANIDMLATALALTDEQKASLKDILTKSEEADKDMVKKAADACQALRAAILAPEFKAEEVAKLSREAGTAERAVVEANIKTCGQIRAIPLTADQLTKLLAQRQGGRMGGGMRPGGGARAGGAAATDAAPPPPPPAN